MTITNYSDSELTVLYVTLVAAVNNEIFTGEDASLTTTADSLLDQVEKLMEEKGLLIEDD